MLTLINMPVADTSRVLGLIVAFLNHAEMMYTHINTHIFAEDMSYVSLL